MNGQAARAPRDIRFDQQTLAPYAKRRLLLPLVIFMANIAAYGACVAGAVLAADLGVKLGFAALAGVFIATLAIIGHDAAHRSFTRTAWLNRLIGTVAFLPALHPYGLWEHHHNRIHHRYTAQIGVDNAYSPMTVAQYERAGRARRAYYRFLRSLAGQPFFYLVDIWLPKMFLPMLGELRPLRRTDRADLALVYAWLGASTAGLALLARATATPPAPWSAALLEAGLYGVLIPFLVWNLFISFVTIVQHTGPNVRWVLPAGRPSEAAQRLLGTVHVIFPNPLDWFFHRVMQHQAHHIHPGVPLYALKAAQAEVAAREPEIPVVEVWTPAYHWRLTRDCKLYDPEADCWRDFKGRATSPEAAAATGRRRLSPVLSAG